MKTITKFLLMFIVLGFFAVPGYVSAKTAEVLIDSGRDSINAVEGVLKIPSGMTITGIQTGRSAILIWLDRPSYDPAASTIKFSGISPGGFQGNNILFVLEGEWQGSVPNIKASTLKAYKNDGAGTPVAIELSLKGAEMAKDDAPPEPFKLSITSAKELYEGQSFLTFLAQDKGTGLARYEFASSWLLPPGNGDWREASSPLPLTSKQLHQRLYIKAIDQEGNYRVSTIGGTYRNIDFLIGIIIGVCLAVLLRARG